MLLLIRHISKVGLHQKIHCWENYNNHVIIKSVNCGDRAKKYLHHFYTRSSGGVAQLG